MVQDAVVHRSKAAMPRRWLPAIVVALLTAASGIACAAAPPEAPPGQLINVPVYDPESKRYFALMHVDSPIEWDSQWDKVNQHARTQVFKGIRGRLAIVDSLEVHEFLLRTFRPNHYQPIWIGLRYLCRSKKLEWSDGRMWQPGSFQFWDSAGWNQDVFTCNSKDDPNDWAPIAYSPEMHGWIAKGRGKGFYWYFIEYPTGQP
jgi:hypothetical protein